MMKNKKKKKNKNINNIYVIDDNSESTLNYKKI